MTLTGCVLPIGGVKEKVLAARRSGVKVVVFPEGNRPEYEELAEDIKQVGAGGWGAGGGGLGEAEGGGGTGQVASCRRASPSVHPSCHTPTHSHTHTHTYTYTYTHTHTHTHTHTQGLEPHFVSSYDQVFKLALEHDSGSGNADKAKQEAPLSTSA